MSENKDIDRKRLVQFLVDVDQEILNMRSGEGRWRPGALYFDKGESSSPVMNRLTIFKTYPTRDNLKQFLEIATQDFGPATSYQFETWSRAIFAETPVERKERSVRPFDVQFKDAFYDMFKTVNIPMTPKQVERIETISLKLSGLFEEKITTTVESQLGALIKALKTKEAAAATAEVAAIVKEVALPLGPVPEPAAKQQFPTQDVASTPSPETVTADIKVEGDAKG